MNRNFCLKFSFFLILTALTASAAFPCFAEQNQFSARTSERTTEVMQQPLIYHGRFLKRNQNEFELVSIKTTQHKNEQSLLHLTFSSPLNPESFERAVIKINENELPHKLLHRFSRDGAQITVFLPPEIELNADSDFSLKISDFESYNGIRMKAVEVENLEYLSKYVYRRKLLQWKKSS